MIKNTQKYYSAPENWVHAKHEIVVKYTCPILNKKFRIKTDKFNLDKEVVVFEQYRELVHKKHPVGIPRIIKGCECGMVHMIFVDDYKFTGLKEAISISIEEWEKKYENVQKIKT